MLHSQRIDELKGILSNLKIEVNTFEKNSNKTKIVDNVDP